MPATEAREHLGYLINNVEHGKEPFVLTKHGRTVVALVPAAWLEQHGYNSNTGTKL